MFNQLRTILNASLVFQSLCILLNFTHKAQCSIYSGLVHKEPKLSVSYVYIIIKTFKIFILAFVYTGSDRRPDVGTQKSFCIFCCTKHSTTVVSGVQKHNCSDLGENLSWQKAEAGILRLMHQVQTEIKTQICMILDGSYSGYNNWMQ